MKGKESQFRRSIHEDQNLDHLKMVRDLMTREEEF